jgi:hypothetical protein
VTVEPASGTFIPVEKQRATSVLGTDSYFTKTGDIGVMTERVQSILKFLPKPSGGAPSEDSQA